MSGRKVALAAIVVLVLVAGAGFQLGWFSSTPPLTIHLRCPDSVSGRLSVSIRSESGESRAEKSFDMKTACAAAKVELEGYRSEESLRITLDRGDGQSSELIARYGTNIQRDQHGFFTVIRITSTPPYLANDSI